MKFKTLNVQKYNEEPYGTHYAIVIIKLLKYNNIE